MPTLRSSTTQAPSGPGGTTISRPSGLESTDVVVLFVVSDLGSAITFTASGFTQVYAGHSADGLGAVELGVLVGTGFSGSGSFTVTPSDSNAWLHVAATAWEDADTTLIVGADNSSGGAPFNLPSITTTVDDAVLLAVLANNFGSVGGTDPSTSLLTAIGNAHGWVHTRGTQGTAGASGVLEFTPGVNSRSSLGVQIAIQPPAASGTTIDLAESLPALVESVTSAVAATYTAGETLPALSEQTTVETHATSTIAEQLPTLGESVNATGTAQIANTEALPTLNEATTLNIGDEVSATLAEQLPALIEATTTASSVSTDSAETLPALGETSAVTLVVVVSTTEQLPAFTSIADIVATVTATSTETLPVLGEALTVEVVPLDVDAAFSELLPALVEAAAVHSGAVLATPGPTAFADIWTRASADTRTAGHSSASTRSTADAHRGTR